MSEITKNILQRSKQFMAMAAILALFSSCASNTYYYSGRGVADDSSGPKSAFEI